MSRQSFLADAISLSIITLLMFALYGATLRGGYPPKDVWESLLITTDKPIHPQLDKEPPAYTAYYDRYRGYTLEREFMLGRFRPVYWTITTLEARLFRNTPFLWHLETILIGAVSAGLVYMTARRLKLSVIPSLVGALLLVISGFNLWVEIAIAEEPAVLLTMLAILLFVEGGRHGKLTMYDWVALVIMVLVGWIKESFTLIVPAMLIGRGVLQWLWFSRRTFGEAFMNLLPLNLVAAVLVLGQIGIQIMVYRTGYFSQLVLGDSIRTWETPIRWLIYAGVHGMRVGMYLPLVVAGLLVIRKNSGVDRRLVWMLPLIGFTWLMPQLLLYTSRGGVPYYFYPSAIVIVIMTSIALEVIYHQTRPLWFYSIIALTLVISYGQIRADLGVAREFLAQSLGFERLVDAVSQDLNCDEHLLFYGNSSLDFGASLLTWLGEANCPVRIDLHGLDDNNLDKMAEASLYFIVDIFEQYDPDTLSAIDRVLVEGSPNILQERPFPGYDPVDWDVIVINEPFLTFPRWSFQTDEASWNFTLLIRR